MRQKLVLALLLALAAALMVSAAAADILSSGTFGGSLTWQMDSSGVLTIGGSGAMPDYSSWDEDRPWQNWLGLITTVVIGPEVETIGSSAFQGLAELTSVTGAEGVTLIGEGAFSYCGALTSVTIPDGVTVIGTEAFCGCDGLLSVTIPSSVTQIGFYAFGDCSGLTEVIFPNTPIEIESGAFSGCVELEGFLIHQHKLLHYVGSETDIVIPDGVVTICESAFTDSRDIQTVTLPASVTTLEDEAFAYLPDLREVRGPAGADEAVYYRAEDYVLYRMTLPATVTHVNGSRTFSYTQVGTPIYPDFTIPWSVEIIEDNAFEHTDATFVLTWADEIGNGAFANCKNLKYIWFVNWGTQVAFDAFDGCPQNLIIISPDYDSVRDIVVNHGFTFVYDTSMGGDG